MTSRIRVKFEVYSYELRRTVELSGTVIDKYRDVITVTQQMPSGKGGIIDLKDYKITVDFYLILADDSTTHKIRCKDLKII